MMYNYPITVQELYEAMKKAIDEGYGNLPVGLCLEDGTIYPVTEGFYDVGILTDASGDTLEAVLMGG